MTSPRAARPGGFRSVSTKEVVSFLNSHTLVRGLPTVALAGEAELVVRCAVFDRDGEAKVELNAIKPTLRAAREWLGY